MVTAFNLATRNARQERRRRLLAGGVLACLVLALAAQLGIWGLLRRRDAGIAERLGAMERELSRHQDEVRAVMAGVSGDLRARHAAKVAALNGILEAATFSWSGLLHELERSVPPGVALGEIQPDPSTGRVGIRGAAKSFGELDRFLRALEERLSFRDVFLHRQSVKRGTDGGPETLEFSITLTYRGRDS